MAIALIENVGRAETSLFAVRSDGAPAAQVFSN
jgi:hypothetical protein